MSNSPGFHNKLYYQNLPKVFSWVETCYLQIIFILVKPFGEPSNTVDGGYYQPGRHHLPGFFDKRRTLPQFSYLW